MGGKGSRQFAFIAEKRDRDYGEAEPRGWHGEDFQVVAVDVKIGGTCGGYFSLEWVCLLGFYNFFVVLEIIRILLYVLISYPFILMKLENILSPRIN